MVPGFRRPVSQNVVPKVGPQILKKKKMPQTAKKSVPNVCPGVGYVAME